jgi:4-amino-4-deoxy-L-arabinose transferase-like glycosyltransferase
VVSFEGGRGWRVAAVLVLLALSSFLQFSVVLGTKVNDPIRADAEKYVSYAYNLKHAGIFSHVNTWEGTDAPTRTATPDKLTLPGYPAFLTLFMDGSPDEAFVRRVVLAQATLGVVSTLLAYFIALSVLPLPWALAAGVLVATSPHMATISTYLITESLFTALLLASTLTFVAALEPNGRRLHWMAAGLLLGLACLVRPQLQLLPLLVLVLVLGVRRWRTRLPHALLAITCFVAVVGPWHARNAVLATPAGQPDLLVNTLYHGSFPNMMYRGNPETYGNPYFYDPDRVQVTRSLSSLVAHVGTLFSEEPVRYARWYLVGKPGFFLSWGMLDAVGGIFIYPAEQSPYLDRSWFKVLRALNFLVHWPLMLLGLLGACLALWKPHVLAAERTRQMAAAVLAALFLYAIALHMVGTPLSRYAIPFRPLIYVLALATTHSLWLRTRGGKVGSGLSTLTRIPTNGC